MGATQSAAGSRSVSLENPHPPSGVIDVSDEVVERLKAGIKKQARNNATTSSSSTSTQSTTTESKQPPEAKTSSTASTPKKESARIAQAIPVQPSLSARSSKGKLGYVQPSGITLTAADVLRQKEIELEQNDAFWRSRIEVLEENLGKTNAIMENEFETAVEDVQKRFINAAPVHQLPPCQDLKAKVIACYRENQRETLKCANEVANFRNCINFHRIKHLETEETKTQDAATNKKVAKAA